MPSDGTKTENILKLYDALRHGERVSQPEWTEELGISRKTFERYIATLRDHLHEKNLSTGQEQDIAYDEEMETYRITGKRNTWISDAELIAICKILIAVRAFDKEALTSLLKRLLTVVVSKKGQEEIGALLKNELFRYDDPAHEALDDDIFFTLVSAARLHHKVRLTYKKPEAEELDHHLVCPVGVLFDQSYFYLVAQAEEGQRVYRLDRVFQAEDTGEVFAESYNSRFQPGNFHNEAPYMFGGGRMHVSFLCRAEALEPLLDRLPGAKAVPEGNHYRVEADTAGEEGILMLLLQQGDRVKILAPASLVQRWKETAETICRMADGAALE